VLDEPDFFEKISKSTQEETETNNSEKGKESRKKKNKKGDEEEEEEEEDGEDGEERKGGRDYMNTGFAFPGRRLPVHHLLITLEHNFTKFKTINYFEIWQILLSTAFKFLCVAS
jgi:hypothetical protein